MARRKIKKTAPPHPAKTTLARKIKDQLAWRGFKSIEFKSFAILLRILAGAVFIVYLSSNAMGLWTWAQVKWARAQSLSRLEEVVQGGIRDSDMTYAENWIAWRPLTESKEITARLEPLSAKLSPLIFLNLAKRAAWLGDREQKNFWVMLARYRLRYDALRCGARDSVGITNRIFSAAYAVDKNFFEDLSQEETIRLTRRVLDFDTKYPAANDPKKTCWLLNKLAQADYPNPPKDDWSLIRFNLRFNTDRELQAAEKALRAEKSGQKN